MLGSECAASRGYSLRRGAASTGRSPRRRCSPAIAERGADAVGYAYRGPATTRIPSSRSSARRRASCSSGSRCPPHATELLVHVRDYTKGHPSIPANNHPVRHGPVVGIHNGIILNDDELLAPHSCARAEPRMTVDSEAIFALAAHSRNDAARARGARRLDGDRLARRARAGHRLRRARRRPAALARPRPRRGLLRLDPGGARDRRPSTPACGCARARSGRDVPRARATAASPAARASAPTAATSRTVRCRPSGRRGQSAYCLARLAVIAARRLAYGRASRRSRRRALLRSRSRTRNWNVDHAPRRASNIR